MKTTKFIFITGGVISSLGKGIAAASTAAILESRGLKVTMLKLTLISMSIWHDESVSARRSVCYR